MVCDQWCGSCELNQGPFKEQEMLATSETSLKQIVPRIIILIKDLVAPRPILCDFWLLKYLKLEKYDTDTHVFSIHRL